MAKRKLLTAQAALIALGKVGPAAAAAVPILEESLADKVRLIAARALGQIGPGAGAALPTLARRLIDFNKPVRQAATVALSLIDASWASTDAIQPMLATLIEGLKRSGDEGQIALDAIAIVGPPAVPPLIEALAAGDRILREKAATALGRIGPPAAAAISALTNAAGKDDHGWVRDAAAQALAKIAAVAKNG